MGRAAGEGQELRLGVEGEVPCPHVLCPVDHDP